MARKNSDIKAKKLSRVNFFSRLEVSEIPKLLMPGEQVLAEISGFYTAGTAILCVTTKRLLLVDKKIMRLSFEDIRFDSIKEVNYSQQVFVASIKFFFAGRELQFRSWYRSELRMLSQLVQHKMFEATEKRHYKAPVSAEIRAENNRESLQQQIQPMNFMEPETFEQSSTRSTNAYQKNPQLEQYLNERIARWRRASRFIDNLTMATKTGRQVLDLEAPKR